MGYMPTISRLSLCGMLLLANCSASRSGRPSTEGPPWKRYMPRRDATGSKMGPRPCGTSYNCKGRWLCAPACPGPYATRT